MGRGRLGRVAEGVGGNALLTSHKDYDTPIAETMEDFPHLLR